MERNRRIRTPKEKRAKKGPRKTINWVFGEKHKEYIRNCSINGVNIAEGAVRAGKTVDNIFAFAHELEKTPDKFHLATGTSMANAKLNIGTANGYGLAHIFKGRSRWGKFNDNDCLYVKTHTGEKIVIFAGGSQENSRQKIIGNSYGLWIATEINLHADSMVKECLNRQRLAKVRKVFWDLNPANPKHKIYTEYIDEYIRKNKEGKFNPGCNYQHFTIFDNASATEDQVKDIIDMYTVGSQHYNRDILGQRIVIEGAVYPGFGDLKGQLLIDIEDIPKLLELNVGIDFGVQKSKHAFVASGVVGNYKKLVILKSKVLPTSIDPVDLSKEYVKFLRSVEETFNKRVDSVFFDAALTPLARGLESESKRQACFRPMFPAKKEKILDRISFTNMMISTKRFLYTTEATSVKDALELCTWKINSEKDVRLEDGSTDIDTLDAMEYSFERNMRRFSNNV